MGGKRSGWKYLVGRSVVAVLLGTLVAVLASLILNFYFPDLSPYWATAIGAIVTVAVAPFPTPRRVPRKPGQSAGDEKRPRF